jgi:hypothetical protein
MKHRSSYKVTFFDRHGAGGALALHAARYAIVVFGLALLMSSVLGSRILGLSGASLIVFTLVCALTLSALAVFAGLRLGAAAGRLAGRVYMGGSSTPYEDQFSQEQALVMRRDYAAALALFEQRIAATPGDSRVRIAAADLYGTHGDNPGRAAELYREVQRIPSVAAGHDIYASNKLADLFLGPLSQPGRALVELRRIAELHAGTPAAEHARRAIANLKEEPGSDGR